jgi:hypothetical protein
MNRNRTRKARQNKKSKTMRRNKSASKSKSRMFILRKGMVGNPNVAGYSAISRLYSSVYGHRRPAALFY